MEYYITNPFIGFYHLSVHGTNTNAIFITDEQYRDFYDGISGIGAYDNNIQKLVFNDKNEPSLIPYINTPEEDKQLFIGQARTMFHKYDYFGYKWNKLTTAQQTKLTAYLDLLNDIVNGTDITSTELPAVPF